jgi:hypothetical protein
MLFLDILAEFLTEDLLYNKVKDYLEIRKGELKDSAFEKFYKTFVVAFVETHRWPDTQQAEKFFNDKTTVDGVLAYLYRGDNATKSYTQKGLKRTEQILVLLKKVKSGSRFAKRSKMTWRLCNPKACPFHRPKITTKTKRHEVNQFFSWCLRVLVV